MWWQAAVIPTTQKAEAGELLESGRQRLEGAKIALLHSSLGDRVRLCLKKRKKSNLSTFKLRESYQTGFYVIKQVSLVSIYF